jgi:hypothetical protein
MVGTPSEVFQTRTNSEPNNTYRIDGQLTHYSDDFVGFQVKKRFTSIYVIFP